MIKIGKIVCKNGCSGKEGFSIEGYIWGSYEVDERGYYVDPQCSDMFEVRWIRCNECEDDWNVGKGEIVIP